MDEMQTTPRQFPEIVENYKDFRPPRKFRRHVEAMLETVPPKYLIGLKTLVLANHAALSRKERRRKMWSRNRKIGMSQVAGSYQRATRSSPATVTLYVDSITKGWPSWFFHFLIIDFLAVGEVLYHEIGHHIHAVHKPIFEGPENVAEDWSRKLKGAFFRSRYPYLVPVLKLLNPQLQSWKRRIAKQYNIRE
jgi:hypothetical protein